MLHTGKLLIVLADRGQKWEKEGVEGVLGLMREGKKGPGELD